MPDRVDEVTRRLIHVRYAVAAVGEAEHSLSEAIDRALEAGATWSQVAELLGTTENAARRRFEDARSR